MSFFVFLAGHFPITECLLGHNFLSTCHLTFYHPIIIRYLSQDCTSANNAFFAELNKNDDINEDEAEDQDGTNEHDEKNDEIEVSRREVEPSTNEKGTVENKQ